ncbi:MAG TPA: hypothetical protein VGG97_25995 [Bryobacteraceae bacterium]|jgi:pseudouridine synthase
MMVPRFRRIRDSAKFTFWQLVIMEGRNRQVRRMIEGLDAKVLKLVRVRLGPLMLEGLRVGEWRDLTAAEVAQLRKGASIKGRS